jgi:phosphoglycolate phosphatase
VSDRTYLFWDIDGTLLTTARAGIFAWEDAVRDVLGAEPAIAAMQTAGLTDAEIALALAAEHGDASTTTAADLLHRYAQLLPERLSWRRGGVLPNVLEILEALADRDDVLSLLLTGNVASGAEAKLRHYDLWRFFTAGGAFSVEGSDRPAIAREARAMAARHGGDVPVGGRMIVIGDTPHDIACGKAIGALTLAVATGPGYALEDLRACEPSMVVAQLPAPAAFLHMIDRAGLRR